MPKRGNWKVFVHSPIHRVFPESVKSILAQASHNVKIDVFFSMADNHPPEELYKNLKEKMNKAREIFLQGEWEFFFNVEQDILLPNGALARLLEDDLPVVSGLYRYRPSKHGHDRFMPRIYDPEGPQDADDRNPEPGKDFKYGDIIKCTFVPFGCLLIKREVLGKIEFRDEGDVDFCRDAWNEGIELFADTGVNCGHIEPDGQIIGGDNEKRSHPQL